MDKESDSGQTVTPVETKEETRPAHLWKPGQSGNPKGRPKRNDKAIVSMLADKYGAPTIHDLIAEGLMYARDGKPAVANSILSYVRMMLEYQVGKPATRNLILHADLDDRLAKWITGADDSDSDIDI